MEKQQPKISFKSSFNCGFIATCFASAVFLNEAAKICRHLPLPPTQNAYCSINKTSCSYKINYHSKLRPAYIQKMYLDTIHTLQSLKNYFPPILAIPNWCTETVEKSGILLMNVFFNIFVSF
jgi:hypothetical protein